MKPYHLVLTTIVIPGFILLIVYLCADYIIYESVIDNVSQIFYVGAFMGVFLFLLFTAEIRYLLKMWGVL